MVESRKMINFVREKPVLGVSNHITFVVLLFCVPLLILYLIQTISFRILKAHINLRKRYLG